MTRAGAALLIAATVWAATSARATVAARSAVTTGAVMAATRAPLDVPAQNALIAEYCSACHTAARKPGGVVLQNFDASTLAANAELGERMILKLRAGMMPPAGSKRPDAAAIGALASAFETRLDAPSQFGLRPHSGWRPSSRLNRAEFARTVLDLTGVEIDPSAYLPPDTISDGFDNIADVQAFSPTLVSGYLRAAAAVSRRAVADRSPAIFVCRPARAAEDGACADRILTRLASAALRGTATADDAADLRRFYRDGRDSGGFDSGIRLAVQALLVHPRFLFRIERSGSAPGAALDSMAIASRLSFFLWGAAPDAALIDAARAGVLGTAAGRRAQAARLLRDRRSEALATRFARQWLRLQDLETLRPDPRRFPGFDEALARSMRRETELFFDSIVREDRSVLTLFDASYTFVDERLARLYGIAGVAGSTFRRVSVADDRRGLLGQASVLASTSVADRTSPVLRGKWVMEVLLGSPPPPPPPNVPALDDSVKAVRDGTPLSTRQRIEEHRRNPACASCHKVIDPIGLALERFDAIGAWRDADNGVPIDAAAELYDGQVIDGAGGLRRALLRREDVLLRNFAARLLTYATGRRLDYRDMPAVRAIVAAAAAQQYRLSAFVAAVVDSAAFTMSAPAEAREDADVHHR